MSVGLGIVFGVVVVIITALVLAPPVAQVRFGSLRDRFGPELDRVAARHHGDTKAAERELKARVRRFGNLRLLSLTASAREEYAAQWVDLQGQFVDCPGAAIAKANRLLWQLAVARGYPADSHARQVEALSVHHPRRVDGIRQLHAAAQQAAAGEAEPEKMRQAMVAGRLLLEELLTTGPQEGSASKARARRLRSVPAQRTADRTRSLG
ncbi:hypothetical protein GCM10009837_19710 [Streptomyces durmitorensis]|uniref:Secreted protein n=1 Tax=Streptomyces durmitorensis TaxID=319947 RepID=A0ABY4PQY1_9ACTN|nr:hypothetical protein [Streptomyces durmitorensis]UQT55363.1 hypothetical protein M4V62_09785 [Streptomyces durmitorensis]